jgi:hypothetical protein
MIGQPKPPQTVRQEMSGGKAVFPGSTVATSIAPNLFPRTWQVGGVVQIAQAVAIPGLSSGAAEIVTANVTLAPYNLSSPNANPLNPIALSVGQQAYIALSVFLIPPATGNPPTSPFFGTPYVRLSFLSGTPVTPYNGGALFYLVGPNTYSGPTAIVSLPVYAPATFSATKVTLGIEAVLLGVPS